MKKDVATGLDQGSSTGHAGCSFDIVRALCEIPALVGGSGKNSDFAVDEALARMGALFSASRAYVMLDEKDGRYLRNTHEWVNQRVGPSMFSWPLYDYEYDIPSLKSLMEDTAFHMANVGSLPDDLREVFIKQGVKSFALAPIRRDGVRIGFVGLDFCEEERPHSDEIAVALPFLAGMLALALERKQFHLLRGRLSSIRTAIADLEPVFENADQEDAAASLHPSKPMTLLDAERRIIIETLELYNGNKLKTAKHLGLTWPSLDRRCKKLGIEVRRR